MFGTMAHAFVEAHDDEAQAFLAFARANPREVVFILDSYDTLAAARKVVAMAPRLKSEGISIRGVRLDSGDLAALARGVRQILDAGGLAEVRIVASGNLDEFSLTGLVREGAPIDGFGIGTQLAASADAPTLECVYKLQQFAERPRRKRSEGKATWPGAKQVFRHRDPAGRWTHDVITLDGAPAEGGEPLLQEVMRNGQRVAPSPSLDAIRRHAADQLQQLPPALLLARWARRLSGRDRPAADRPGGEIRRGTSPGLSASQGSAALRGALLVDKRLALGQTLEQLFGHAQIRGQQLPWVRGDPA